MTVATVAADPQGPTTAGARRSIRTTPRVFLGATVLLALHAMVATVGPLFLSWDPVQMLTGEPFAGPSSAHWLGTDSLGRDVASRLVAGERMILAQSLSASAIAVLLGSLLGIGTAYVRGWFDTVVMRVIEIVLSFPSLIIAMLLLAAWGANRASVAMVVGTLFVAPTTTVIRPAALNLVEEDFVTAARLRGESWVSIAGREILPNVMASVFVEFSLRTGYAAILIGSLGFLGFGAAPPSPDWGLMINEGRAYLSTAPLTVLAPALGLGTLVVALSLFTEGLTDLLSPRGLGGRASR
jgi:peptide/nickel transport system permease protein